VQQDGGDIRLVRFEPLDIPEVAQAEGAQVTKGRVWVEMLGACKSCKSSKTTLKDLIE
ncbi:MAG: hypothetical protein COY86_09675, partial [Rhodobacterales bacterium CG_4_10_14_0_8_um_filter_70_9]